MVADEYSRVPEGTKQSAPWGFSRQESDLTRLAIPRFRISMSATVPNPTTTSTVVDHRRMDWWVLNENPINFSVLQFVLAVGPSEGRTAHSVLKLPLNLGHEEMPVCNISKSSERGRMLQQCKLLVWDECTMAHKRAIEALDRTIKDIKGNRHIMGGMVVLLAGDNRRPAQTSAAGGLQRDRAPLAPQPYECRLLPVVML
ncbi:hypothetical protein EVAR_64595_1 [Eumeta japonica]|uniref:ATP-dependent DNA helicase n=1 Tax=Eumeta variegata TaxID=151549 RepID=A0A4C1Z7U2_EUMVA|nr:hypothetical protein EVAR_64595_1 [Eumeta japonica]